MTTIALKVEVPIACFRQSRAREYVETYPVPPPSTVYGMLLSLVGEVNRYKHCGVKLAIALISEPAKSTVIRTFHRLKTKNIHDPKNNKPDYQELLTNIEFVVWVDAGVDKAKPNLVQRLEEAFTNPASINRFGGLCLGESRDLVNDITLLPKNYYAELMRWLIQDEYGLLTLPYWVDHVGSRGTRWLSYEIQECQVLQPPELSWTSVQSD
ncbi:type I-MYXAN CRISPR-associated protein Cas5/Cmx5/DevS [Calothrix sp. FACHB-1219]|uniref:type I-MYXAN CRISPR-associated protein Cas5/Cmx5/DevS n=1 Tax=unclassified Calothrix TaxID=2619626 RepID=UPI00168989CC|nr:type I-MYXAN CRISPR-associated protein Cas5/Cmx5/DevS [Calothrix sp. FACHB-168]MBD2203536.1 type I-MYXAN CRISPR-associated protein Cas5/Cmx5/DevS [Calothrix sp. FACHB-168]MBD2221147.1 type I-MYXAN CRISPR-associated protein Cas5/Cmx5/DevS [Calothrix sp. FACHB-1219]